MTGQTVAHYRVLERLGEGGMGVVYKAEDLKLHRNVALKFPPRLVEEHNERFLREARAAASLNHPNICTIYEVNEALGFLAMELIEGVSIRQKIEARPLALEETLDVGIQVCAGLQAAHAKGVVHRDIKPENLMMTPQGLVKIMDFGLAQTAGASPLTKAGLVVGTPAYMSPEQLDSKSVDRRTDIWSLGIVLYEMLSGRLPFEGDTMQALSLGILQRGFEPLTALRSNLPKELDRIVAKALRKDPEERYSNVEDVAADLRGLMSGAPVKTASSRVRIYAAGAVVAAAVGGGVWFGAGRQGRSVSRQIEAIAVLPLENLSRDPEQEFFADGMTEELIGEVARVGSLRVISRTSVMQYKNTRKMLRDIARELNVQAILTGTVAQSGTKVRITAQLIRPEDEQHLWSEKYERELSDVLALQGEVARSIAGRIKIQLTPAQQSNLTRSRKVNSNAYEVFLRGNYLLNHGIPGLSKSLELFTEAIKLDETFAEAHAGLAQALVYTGIYGIRPSYLVNPQARTAAQRALELDPSSAAAHTVLADVKKGYDWDLAGAEVEYQLALQLNPSHLMTHYWYAECLSRMRRYDDSIAASRKGVVLDPVSPLSHNNLGMLFYRARRYEESIASCQRGLELDANFVNAYWWQGLCYAAKKDFPAAIDSLTTAIAKNRAPILEAHLAYIHARAGEVGKARETLDRMLAVAKNRYVSPADLSVIYLGLNDADSVFFWLEKAYHNRDSSAHALMMPHYDALRSDPRYGDLCKRVGLPV